MYTCKINKYKTTKAVIKKASLRNTKLDSGVVVVVVVVVELFM